jgi:putative lipoic acid-binding regulatory protein
MDAKPAADEIPRRPSAAESAAGVPVPGAREITAVGNASVGLEQRVPEIIAALGMSVLEGSRRTRASSEGRYVSVSVTFTCPSREKYDAAHAALRADPDVRWTL